MLKRLFVLMFFLAFLACSSFALYTINFTAKDNNKTFEIRKDRAIKIMLVSNPTTGYDWYFDNLDKSYFKAISQKFIIPNRRLVGAPGKDVWVLQPKKTGDIKINLLYYRKWEGKDKAADSFTINLQIK